MYPLHPTFHMFSVYTECNDETPTHVFFCSFLCGELLLLRFPLRARFAYIAACRRASHSCCIPLSYFRKSFFVRHENTISRFSYFLFSPLDDGENMDLTKRHFPLSGKLFQSHILQRRSLWQRYHTEANPWPRMAISALFRNRIRPVGTRGRFSTRCTI